MLIIRALLGAGVVLLIGWAAGSRNFVLAGLVPLFPTFALIAHITVYQQRGAQALRQTALFGICALLPYLVYLLLVYLLAEHGPLGRTLSLASLGWVLSAGLLLLVWQHLA